MREVANGIDVFDFGKLRNARVALVVNYSSVTKKLDFILDVASGYGLNLLRVFTPEHGLYGLPDGEKVGDTVDAKYGIPIFSLYGSRSELDPGLLEGVDVLVYDIQDVGLRYYTFIYALANALIAAAKANVELIVLDRVNPLGRAVYGPRIPDELNSPVGGFRLPVRYGLTPGELALYYKKLLNLDVEVDVVRCVGWRGQLFSEVDLLWNVPSPNLPTFSSTLCYAGICFFEATNVSVGRGTTKPFEFIGAPWIDGDDMLTFLRRSFPNLRVRKRDFVPMHREYAGQVCHGVEFFPTVEDNFFEVAIELFKYLRSYGEFTFDPKRLDQLTGVVDFASNPDELRMFDLEDFISFVDDLLLYR